MFASWRQQLRQAEAALDEGRLDEAQRLLAQGRLREFWPAQQLLQKLAGRLAQRCGERLARGESSAGWHDLDTAAELGISPDQTAPLREQLMHRTLEEAVELLRAGQTREALARLDQLAARGVDARELRSLRRAAVRIDAARRAARAARFAEAESEWSAAALLYPQAHWIEAQRNDCQQRAHQHRALTQRLHEQLRSERWTEVAATADEMLALAPDDPLAGDARRRAWAAVGVAPAAGRSPAPHRALKDTPPMTDDSSHVAHPARDGKRRLLWVDAVGGFLVCEGSAVVLGQPVPGRAVDVPILGDLSARHAIIRRVGEGYLLEPIRKTLLDGQPVGSATTLSDGQVIQLGDVVRLRFRRPHPLCASARLEFVSSHRTQPPTDGVILLADACVLGPAPQAHVVCRDWQREVVLYRTSEGLGCRTEGRFEIDGQACEERGVAGAAAHIAGDDFSLGLEELA